MSDLSPQSGPKPTLIRSLSPIAGAPVLYFRMVRYLGSSCPEFRTNGLAIAHRVGASASADQPYNHLTINRLSWPVSARFSVWGTVVMPWHVVIPQQRETFLHRAR